MASPWGYRHPVCADPRIEFHIHKGYINKYRKANPGAEPLLCYYQSYCCFHDWKVLLLAVCSPPTCVTPSAGQTVAPQPPPDDAEQQAALLLACSGDTLPASLPPVNMYDLFEALQVSSLHHAVVTQGGAVLSISYHSWVWFMCTERGLISSSHSQFPSFPLKLSYLALTCSHY